MKCSRDGSICRMIAVLSSEKYRACVLVWTVIRPSASGLAMQPVVSVGACSVGEVW